MTPDTDPAPIPRKAKSTRSPDNPIALVLIDDNRLLREGLAALLRDQPSFKVLAALDDAEAALERARLDNPDVVVIDVGLDGQDPLTLTAAVHKVAPRARVIVKGVQPSHCDAAQYLRAGASGFIMKDDSIEKLSETIRCVAAGCQVLPPAVIALLAGQITYRDGAVPHPETLEAMRLTEREQEVVALLGEGLNNKAIAARLNIAVHTVKSHVHNVLEKLALHSRLEVAAFAHTHPPAEH